MGKQKSYINSFILKIRESFWGSIQTLRLALAAEPAREMQTVVQKKIFYNGEFDPGSG